MVDLPSGFGPISFYPPSLLSCDPAITPGGSGILTTLIKLMTNFRKLAPFFYWLVGAL